ncbi:MAG: DUF1501 domain-containing protein [Rhodothermaceae bacterium]|nr:DUF1501 domain-containing protein [Rhodothermaceae bacterium]
MHSPKRNIDLPGSKLEHGAAHQAAHDRWTRRNFMGSLGLMAGGALMLGSTPVRAFQPTPLMTHLHQEESDRVLVLVQLFGGNDGLNTLIPFDDDEYYRVRPSLAIPKSEAIPFQDNQGFHPSLSSLVPIFDDGRMGIIQGVGYPDPDLSHFRSTDIWLTSSEPKEYLKSGWVGRSVETILDQMGQLDHPLAVQLGSAAPLLFKGTQRTTGMTINNPEQFDRLAGSGKLYDTEAVPDSPLGTELAFARSITNDAFRFAGTIQSAAQTGTNSVDYPRYRDFGANMAIVARLIKGNLGAKIYHVVLNGFDTHVLQANRHQILLQTIADSISAFTQDLASEGRDKEVLIMTFSEFGRRVGENGSNGTEHGTSAPLFLFGPRVHGGVYGSIPNLTDLDRFGNLKLQYNFRNVYHNVLLDWFGFSTERTSSIIGQDYANIGFINNAVGINTVGEQPARSFSLSQNYPNPFRDQTTIRYELDQPGPVQLQVFDLQGRMVKELTQGTQPAGEHSVTFSAGRLPAGTYMCRLSANGSQETRKMILVR